MTLEERDDCLLQAIKDRLFIVENGSVINTKTKTVLGKHFANGNTPLNFAFNGKIIVAKRVRFLWLYHHGKIPANHIPKIIDHEKPLTIDNIRLVPKKDAQIDHSKINKNQRLTDEQVLAMRELYSREAFSVVEKAVETELSTTTIRNILVGHSYQHVGGPIATAQEVKDNHKRIGKSVAHTFSIQERDGAFLQMLADGRLRVENNRIYNGVNGRELASEARRDNQAITGKYKNVSIGIMRSRLLWLAYKGVIPEGYHPTRRDTDGPVVIENLHLVSIQKFCSEASKKCKSRHNVGERRGQNNRTKLDDKVLALRREYREKPFIVGERARQLGVTSKTLSDALKGKTYADIPEAILPQTIQAYKNMNRAKVTRPTRAEVTAFLEQAKPAPKSKPAPKPKVEKPVVKTKRAGQARPAPISPPVEKPKIETPVVEKPVFKEPVLPKTVVVDRQAVIDKQKQDRLFQIKMAAQRLDQRRGESLTPFKKFALYHLNHLGYSYDVIRTLIRDLENEDVLHAVVKNYDAANYEAERQRLLSVYGEDSKMLLAIKIHEVKSGDHEIK